jgi:hypothetical protein
MRRPIVAVAVAALILAAATAAGLGLAACGGSSGTATTQAAATGAPGGGQPPDMSAMFTQALDPLVEDGTITSDQETAVVEALASAMPGPGGQGGQMPSYGATPPSGQMPSPGATPQGGVPQQGSMPAPSQMFSSALDSLVSDGTITAAQGTAIAEALGAAMQQGGPGGQQGTTQTGTSSSTSSTQTY